MPTNADEFAKDLFTIGVKLGEDTDKVVRKVALQALTTITFSTPWDTGRARGNWQVSTETPITAEIAVEDPQGGPTIAKGQQVIQAADPGKEIFIANNVPYIEFLNQGSSAQAPANFVQLAVQAAVNSVRGAKVL